MFDINQDYCTSYAILSIFLLAKNIINIIKVMVPLLLIIMSMIDVVKNVISIDKDGKILSKKTLDRFISAAFVFLVISIVDTVLSVLGVTNIGLTTCWTGATKENVKNLKEIERNETNEKNKQEDEARKNALANNGEIDLALRDELFKASSQSSSSSSGNNGATSDGSLQQADGSCVKNYVIRSKQAIVDEALKYVGNPYVYGGTSLTNGIDCSAFTQQIMAKFGAQITRTTVTQVNDGAPVGSIDQAEPGDLILYNGHVAIYMGNNKIVHASNSAPYPQGGIKVSDNAQYQTIVAIRRIIC